MCAFSFTNLHTSIFINSCTFSAVQRLAASRSRPQPQISCGCGQDFDQRAAAGGCAPSTAGYCRSWYIKSMPYFAK